MTQKAVPPLHGIAEQGAADVPVSTPDRIAEHLRYNCCRSDHAFDKLLEHGLRTRSRLHWTPLDVAIQAAKWISDAGICSVVDIGSGAGKFCVAAALSEGSASYLGIEQRHRLVLASRDLAKTLEVEHRVSFFQGTFGVGDLPRADAYYMYNPFGENLFGPQSQIDGVVVPSLARYRREVAAAERMLADLPLGTYLLTYNGFGGSVPGSFEQVRVDRELPNVLQLWRKSHLRGSWRARSTDDEIEGAGCF